MVCQLTAAVPVEVERQHHPLLQGANSIPWVIDGLVIPFNKPKHEWDCNEHMLTINEAATAAPLHYCIAAKGG